MQNSTKKERLHAHWDCFGGATASAMLGACLDAAGSRLVSDIQMNIQQGLPDLMLTRLQVSKSETASMSANVINIILKEGHADDFISLEQLQRMLATADSGFIPRPVCEKAEMVFMELRTAQNVVHGSSGKAAVFSLTSVVEVAATLMALHSLQVETVSCGALPLGEGSIWSEENGLLPLPSPITLQLMIGMPTRPSPSLRITNVELVTATAAALLRVLTNVSGTSDSTHKVLSCFTPRTISVGADGNCSESRVLRLLLGESNTNDTESSLSDRETKPEELNHSVQNDQRWKMDKLTQLEANLDDITGEQLAFAVQLLLDNGAVDAWIVPIVMKKGRAAHTLHCLCHSKDSIVNRLLELMFRHTTTLGVRIHRNLDRAALRRSFLSVESPFHESNIQVKIGYLGDEVVSIKAEFDDCSRITGETNVPIKQVADYATRQAQIQLELANSKE